MLTEFILSEEIEQKDLTEIEILKNCKHQNIIDYIESFIEKKCIFPRLCIVTTYYEVD